MDQGVATFALSVAGGVIVLLLAILGFFLARIVSDVKSNTSDIGKNKGRVELVELQHESEVKRIEQMTQLELKGLSDNVGELTKNVNTLVVALAKKGIDSD